MLDHSIAGFEDSVRAQSVSPRVPFLNLIVQDPEEREALLAAVARVLDHGRIVQGPEVAAFEHRVAALCDQRYCVGVGSGTDALILAMRALGIGPGDEVITTPLSWLGTTNAILINGATPVFCDIDETFNMDPRTLEALITQRTKAILPVHFTGHLAPMDDINSIARTHGLFTIEDGAQAFGARFGSRPAGAFGHVACLSFNAMKVLGALGDAGAIVTDDPEIAEKVSILRGAGVVNRETCVSVSHNCRLDTLQAAILLERLELYPSIIQRRQAIADRYDRKLSRFVTPPRRVPGCQDTHYTYTIRTPHRDALRLHLTEQGIETKIQHPIILNDQPAYQGRVRGHSPRAAQMVREIICLPGHEKLTRDEQDMVVEAIASFFKSRS